LFEITVDEVIRENFNRFGHDNVVIQPFRNEFASLLLEKDCVGFKS